MFGNSVLKTVLPLAHTNMPALWIAKFRFLSMKARHNTDSSTHGICGRQSATGAGSSPSISAFFCRLPSHQLCFVFLFSLYHSSLVQWGLLQPCYQGTVSPRAENKQTAKPGKTPAPRCIPTNFTSSLFQYVGEDLVPKDNRRLRTMRRFLL
jgi:hypothetical protein